MIKLTCPINFECAGYPCENKFQCKDLAISWEIPYYTQNGALIVRLYGWRCEWDDEAHGTHKSFCPLPSGSYKRLESDSEEEMKTRIKQSWLEVGWAAAVDL